MRVGSVTCSAVVDDWKSDREYERDVEVNLIKKWVNDRARVLVTDQQLQPKMALLEVQDYRALLPEDYKWEVQVAFGRKENGCITKEQVVEWSLDTLDGTQCKFNVSLECPKCCERNCSCSTASVTMVDVDVLWASSHPETMVSYMRHFVGFGGTTQRGQGYKNPLEHFSIIRPAQNNFFASEAFLTPCNGLGLDNRVEYSIQHPNIITNIREGQILISYMGVALDNEGWMMIPDIPEVFEAIQYHIDAKLARRDYAKNKTSANRVYWQDMLSQTERITGRAKNKLQIPSAAEWQAVMLNHYNKLMPYWHRDANFNRFEGDRYRTPNETYNVQR